MEYALLCYYDMILKMLKIMLSLLSLSFYIYIKFEMNESKGKLTFVEHVILLHITERLTEEGR